MLWRALASRVRHEDGFYIDVGAYDPDADSVTRTFYDHGWRGVNVEPVQAFFQRFVERRPEDVNLPLAVSDRAGKITFHEIVGQQLGTVVDAYADKHSRAGHQTRTYEVETTTLNDICERYADGRTIHFLKIDVEGHEGAALRGLDLRRHRPWILVVEATEPTRVDILTHAEWDRYVRRAGYLYVGTVLPNRYYVAREHAGLRHAFKLPPDVYHRGDQITRREELETEVSILRSENDELKRFKGGTWAAGQPAGSQERLLFIGCSTDKRFVEPTAVMLASVDRNGEVPDAVVVVAGFGLDDADKAQLRAGAGRLAARLSFFDITLTMLHDVQPGRFTDEYPPAVLGKLLISDYIGERDGRLLTLDSDMIVNGSLRPAMEMDWGEDYFAAIHDPPRRHDLDYFNSGLTIAELSGLRRHDVGRRCLRYIAEHRPHFPDQDALNAVIGRSWVRLERSWNHFCYGEKAFTLEDYEGARVAHFAGPKPWIDAGHPGRALYERHLAVVRRATADAAILSEPEARDLLASSYEVLLGRELDSLDLVRDRGRFPRGEILRGIMRSPEFLERVLASCTPDRPPFPDGRFAGRPSLRQRLWAADHLAHDERGRSAMERSASWHELLEAVVRDSPHLREDRGDRQG